MPAAAPPDAVAHRRHDRLSPNVNARTTPLRATACHRPATKMPMTSAPLPHRPSISHDHLIQVVHHRSLLLYYPTSPIASVERRQQAAASA
ncbi:hypothetical protein ACLOJK_019973 [Asimina triloba]